MLTRGAQETVWKDLSGGGWRALRSIQGFILWNRGFRQRPALAYAASCMLIGFAIGVRLLLAEALTEAPYITIFPAVIIATFLGGLGPGLVAAGLGGLGAWYFLLPTTYSFVFAADAQPVSLIVYLGVAGFGCLLINWLIRIAEQNAALASRNDLLLRELQHRVKNHLQIVSALLNVQATRAEPSAREALPEARRRLDVISSLYANSSLPTEQVDVAGYLQRICATAQQSFGHAHCDVSVTVPPSSLTWSMDRILPLSLIANKLFTNAFRHGLAQGGRADRGRVAHGEQRSRALRVGRRRAAPGRFRSDEPGRFRSLDRAAPRVRDRGPGAGAERWAVAFHCHGSGLMEAAQKGFHPRLLFREGHGTGRISRAHGSYEQLSLAGWSGNPHLPDLLGVSQAGVTEVTTFRETVVSDPVAHAERVQKRSGRSWSLGLLAIPLVALGLGASFLSPDWQSDAGIGFGPQVDKFSPAGRLSEGREQVVHSAGWHPAIEIGMGPVGPLPGDGLGRRPAERTSP